MIYKIRPHQLGLLQDLFLYYEAFLGDIAVMDTRYGKRHVKHIIHVLKIMNRKSDEIRLVKRGGNFCRSCPFLLRSSNRCSDEKEVSRYDRATLEFLGYLEQTYRLDNVLRDMKKYGRIVISEISDKKR